MVDVIVFFFNFLHTYVLVCVPGKGMDNSAVAGPRMMGLPSSVSLV